MSDNKCPELFDEEDLGDMSEENDPILNELDIVGDRLAVLENDVHVLVEGLKSLLDKVEGLQSFLTGNISKLLI